MGMGICVFFRFLLYAMLRPTSFAYCAHHAPCWRALHINAVHETTRLTISARWAFCLE